jgi:hypothetical protein
MRRNPAGVLIDGEAGRRDDGDGDGGILQFGCVGAGEVAEVAEAVNGAVADVVNEINIRVEAGLNGLAQGTQVTLAGTAITSCVLVSLLG